MIYLDNAATTRMDPEVIDAMTRSMREDFANSGAVYQLGLNAKRRIQDAQAQIARCLRLPAPYQIIFTSGGSESNNLFIKGMCFPERKTAYLELEHPSVTTALESLKEFGNPPFSLLKHQTDGRFDLEAVKVLREHRVRLLCLGHVNNETGVVQDIPAIAAALREGSPQTQLFVDGVQAAGKWDYTPGFWEGVAGYSLSAHKFNGPKGIGLLIYESRLNPRPQIHGGRQQYGVRSGTLPVPLIVGLAKALEVSTSRGAKVRAQLQALRRRLVDGLREMQRNDPHFKLTFNSLPDAEATHQSPAIVNFSFPPVEGEVILHHLEKNEIFVGLGSACSAYSKEPSRILRGIGRTVEEALCSLRVSFDGNNTLQDVDAFLQEFRQAYTALYPVYHRKAAHP